MSRKGTERQASQSRKRQNSDRQAAQSRTSHLAVLTGASTGIGYELAKCCAENGFDLLVAADEAQIAIAAREFRAMGVQADSVEADLANLEGIERLCAALNGKTVDVLVANAGRGLGGAFLDQDFDQARRIIDTNITGTVYLLYRIGRLMRSQGHGRILVTGSIAGFIPGSFSAVYNATKAFIDSFSLAIRNELKDSGVTVTCLMPGATDTEFFERAGMTETRIGRSKKDDPAQVAKIGFDAMMRGDGDIVSGWRNKIQSAVAAVTPAAALAEMYGREARPQRRRNYKPRKQS